MKSHRPPEPKPTAWYRGTRKRAIQALKSTKKNMVATTGKALRAISGPRTLEAKLSTPSKMLSTTDWNRPGTMAFLRAPRTKNRTMNRQATQADSSVLVMANWVTGQRREVVLLFTRAFVVRGLGCRRVFRVGGRLGFGFLALGGIIGVAETFFYRRKGEDWLGREVNGRLGQETGCAEHLGANGAYYETCNQ